MLRDFLRATLITIAIPVVGYLVGAGIIGNINSDLAPDNVTVGKLCAFQLATKDQDLQAGCDEYRQILLLKESSLWAGVAAIGLMGIYFVTSLICGQKRRLVAAVFPKLITLSLVVVSVLVLVQGAILTYASYIGPVYAMESYFPWVVAAIGIGALVGAFKLIGSTFSINKPLVHHAFAKEIDSQHSGKLWEFVEKTAEDVGARKPDNVIVGLEPNFYAVAADVGVINEDKELSGETMFLSLPLMRLLTIDELRAVVGHELGHFRGEDAAYSLKFAPVFVGLENGIYSLSEEEGGISSLAKLPALSMLSLMFELFSRNVQAIGRQREFEADKVGADASSSEALATALGKISVFALLWGDIRNKNVDRLNSGKITANLSQVYEDSARFDISNKNLEELLGDILSTKISHPTDTHPTIEERFRNIEFDAASLTVETLTERGNSSFELFDDLIGLEEELTLDEHRLMVAMGAVQPPDEEEEDDDELTSFLNAMYSLAAAMVGADGEVLQSEVSVAERIGTDLFPSFDPVEFRSSCNNLDDLPAFTDVVDVLTPMLNHQQKDAIYGYLKDIALADDDLADDERKLLLYAREHWELEV